ncbi:MAG: hypothetical protein GWN38_18160 [Nitrospinaceae bacterium]|nr:hypothetical protein [Nitrospinaceae bacterium]
MEDQNQENQRKDRSPPTPSEKYQREIKEPPPLIKKRTRMILAFLILSICTILILFTGPGFGFVWQVILSGVLFFFLFWLVT